MGDTMTSYAIQAGALRENPNSGPDGVGVQADIAYTLEARAEVQAVCGIAAPKPRHANDNTPNTGHPLRFLSVCSGIEAASVAFGPLGWKAVAFSEIDPAPCSVLKHHYPDVPNLGDMTKFKEWPNYGKDGSDPIQLVCGGTPCQAFSVAGLREGLNDPRGNLSLTFLAIVDKYRPKWVLFENVPGLLSSATHLSADPSEPEISLDGDNGPGDGEEVVVEDEYDADESHAFSCFLAGLSELGYGVAYRVIDAKYVRVDGFAGAVPQRRRRVFVVGYLGDWRRAAAVLLEPESMSGNPAPSRKAGQTIAAPVAPCLVSSGRGSERAGDTRGQDPVVAVTFDRQSSDEYGTDPVASTVSARDYKSPSDLVVAPEIASTLTRGAESQGKGGYAGRRQEDDVNLVARSVAIRGREDGSTIELGDDVAHALRASQGGGDKAHVLAPIAFAQNSRDEVRLQNGDGSICGALSAEPGMKQTTSVAQPIAFETNMSPQEPDATGVHPTLTRKTHASVALPELPRQEWAVRRLTPVECARLQGFPDDYLSQVLHNGKPLADGPMYKGLGNSWPVNSIRWIGRRIELVEEIARELDAANDNTKKKSEAA